MWSFWILNIKNLFLKIRNNSYVEMVILRVDTYVLVDRLCGIISIFVTSLQANLYREALNVWKFVKNQVPKKIANKNAKTRKMTSSTKLLFQIFCCCCLCLTLKGTGFLEDGCKIPNCEKYQKKNVKYVRRIGVAYICMHIPNFKKISLFLAFP